MAVAAEHRTSVTEQAADFLSWELEFEGQVPREATRISSEAHAVSDAERFIGQVALGGSIEQPDPPRHHTDSLMEAVHRARSGDMVARKLIETNVRTDVIERTIKAGHIMKVQLDVDDNGQIGQYGQTVESIQANSLRFASHQWQMRERTVAETRNMFRINHVHKQGLLKDYAFVVFSRAADNMTPAEAAGAGFTDTMSCAIQLTTAEGNALSTESAFVGGTRTSSSSRHDGETIVRLGAHLGADYSNKTAAQILDAPLLIHKDLIPNGVIDIVKMYDRIADTFFGQAVPAQDYKAYALACRRREAELEPTVQEIVDQIIARADAIHSPLDATRTLHEVSQANLVSLAVTDEKIDVMVFGVESASYIEAARHWYEHGNQQQANVYLIKAQTTADSRSCPGEGRAATDLQLQMGYETQTDKNVDDSDCEFISKSCPMCGAKDIKTTIRKLSTSKKHISGSCGCSKIVS